MQELFNKFQNYKWVSPEDKLIKFPIILQGSLDFL